MPYVIELDGATGVVRIAVDGVPTLAEIRDAMAAIWSTPEFLASPRALWDFRNADLAAFSAAELRAVASLEAEERPAIPPSQIAMLVAREVDFGVLRMLEAFVRSDTVESRIFRDLDAAWSWIQR